MESIRHLCVWLAVGTGHAVMLVSLLGQGSTPSGQGADTLLDIVWSEPEAVVAPLVLVSPPRPPAATKPTETPVSVPRSAPQQSSTTGRATPGAVSSSGETGVVRGEPPSFAERIEPAYPRGARLAGIEGVVRLRLEVTALGALRRSEVLESSGDAALDRAALQAAEASSYRPARVGGEAVEAVVEASYRFELR